MEPMMPINVKRAESVNESFFWVKSFDESFDHKTNLTYLFIKFSLKPSEAIEYNTQVALTTFRIFWHFKTFESSNPH